MVMVAYVHYNFLCFLHIQVEIVVLAPHGQAAHLTPHSRFSYCCS